MSSHPPMEKLEAGSESGPPCDLAAGRVVTLNRARWDRWAMPTGVSKTLTNWLLVGR